MATEARPTRRGSSVHLRPRTRWGWWAVAMAAGLAISLLALYASILTGQAKGYALAVVIPVGLSIAFAAAAGAAGFVSVVAKGERSILVYLCVGIGVVFVGAWILSPVLGIFGVGPSPSPPPVPPRLPPPPG